MRKSVIFLLMMLILFLLAGCSCVKPKGENQVINYKGNQYYLYPILSYEYRFTGSKHYACKVVFIGGHYFADVYALDSDVEENILFADSRWFWIKEGYDFPTKTTIADSVKLGDYTYKEKNEPIEIKLDIKNCSFDQMFTLVDTETLEKIKKLDLGEMTTPFKIFLTYEDNIEFYTWLVTDEDNNLYIEKLDLGNINNWYIMSDIYKEAIIEYLK